MKVQHTLLSCKSIKMGRRSLLETGPHIVVSLQRCAFACYNTIHVKVPDFYCIRQELEICWGRCIIRLNCVMLWYLYLKLYFYLYFICIVEEIQANSVLTEFKKEVSPRVQTCKVCLDMLFADTSHTLFFVSLLSQTLFFVSLSWTLFFVSLLSQALFFVSLPSQFFILC